MSREHFSSFHPVLIAIALVSSACSLQSLDQLKGSGGAAGASTGGAAGSAGTGASGWNGVGSEIYLSDLDPTAAENAWGPFEKDTSNGEEASGDGKPLQVAGEKFDKGLGTHALSKLSYHLGGEYTHLSTRVGVDDEVTGAVSCKTVHGSVVFQVELDGETVFTSDVLTLGDAAVPAELDLAGAETLTLRVSDAGDGQDCDHGDWLGARVIQAPRTPDSTPPVVSDVKVEPSANGATISWSSDDTALGFVDYGTGTALDTHVDEKTWTRRHSVTLSNLASGQKYSFKVGATNRDGLSSSGSVQELTQEASGAPPIPTGAKLVTDFGAVPNDGADDVAAILAAAQAAGDGGSVGFPPGTYDIGGAPIFPSGRSYVGSGATLKGKGPDGQMFNLKGDDVLVAGFTLDGGGIFIDKPGGGFNVNIEISWNQFLLNTSGDHASAITATSGLQSSKITNNHFTGYNGSFGIYGYNYNGLVIANNEFVDITAGMHIDAFGNSGNLLVEQNYIKGVKGMGMEFQSSANGLVFQDNWYEHPNLSSDPTKNGNSMAFSLILAKSQNISIRRNTVIAPERPDGKGCRIGFELGGDNTIAEDNYVNGVNHVAAMNDGDGTASVKFDNNRIADYLEAPSCSFCKAGTTFEAKNNGPDVSLTWDIGRGPPKVGKRY